MATPRKRRVPPSPGRKLQMRIEEYTRIGALLDGMESVLSDGDIMKCDKCGQHLEEAEIGENLEALHQELRWSGAYESEGSALEDRFSALSFEEQNALAKAVEELGLSV